MIPGSCPGEDSQRSSWFQTLRQEMTVMQLGGSRAPSSPSQVYFASLTLSACCRFHGTEWNRSIPRSKKAYFESSVMWAVEPTIVGFLSRVLQRIQQHLCIAAGSLFRIKKPKDFETGLILASVLIRQHHVWSFPLGGILQIGWSSRSICNKEHLYAQSYRLNGRTIRGISWT